MNPATQIDVIRAVTADPDSPEYAADLRRALGHIDHELARPDIVRRRRREEPFGRYTRAGAVGGPAARPGTPPGYEGPYGGMIEPR